MHSFCSSNVMQKSNLQWLIYIPCSVSCLRDFHHYTAFGADASLMSDGFLVGVIAVQSNVSGCLTASWRLADDTRGMKI